MPAKRQQDDYDGAIVEVPVKKQKKGREIVVQQGPARTSALLAPTMLLTGHSDQVFSVCFSPDGANIASGSHDKTILLWKTYGELAAWDTLTGEQTARLTDHKAIVNSCCPMRRGPPLVVSGSDDGTARLWDTRARRAARKLTEKFPITSVALNEAGDQVFTGGVENVVRCWDLRKDESAFVMQGHSDTITGMK